MKILAWLTTFTLAGQLLSGAVAARPFPTAAQTPQLSSPAAPLLCAPQQQLQTPTLCPPLGPGAYAAQLATALVPEPRPVWPAEQLPKLNPVVEYTYARVTTPEAPLFATVADALANNVTRTLGAGFIFVHLVNSQQEGEQVFYQIQQGEYIRAADVSLIAPTDFRGQTFTENPAQPFGWIVVNVRPSLKPGMAAPPKGPIFMRRTPVQIFATQRVSGWDWYLIGQQQWVEQRALAKVELNPPPEGVSGKWIQVNLYEQTLAAYEDQRVVFATLVSSGLDKWATRPGLFSIYARYKVDGMQGAYEPDGSDYYYLEMVPWVMYFDGQRALHGEYWHDRLGFKRSHGCVNLAPHDARWLFNWTTKGVPVWVYDPSGQTPTEAESGSAP